MEKHHNSGYILAKMEDQIGSPEHPLSDSGLLVYRSYWKEKITEYLLEQQGEKTFSVKGVNFMYFIRRNGMKIAFFVFQFKIYSRKQYSIVLFFKICVKKLASIPMISSALYNFTELSNIGVMVTILSDLK